MRKTVLALALSGVSSLLTAALLTSSRAQAVPLTASPLAPALYEAKAAQHVRYSCRGSPHGSACARASARDRPVPYSRAHAGKEYLQHQPRPSAAPYNSFYWANPQGSD